jgi:hypothetical protein
MGEIELDCHSIDLVARSEEKSQAVDFEDIDFKFIR